MTKVIVTGGTGKTGSRVLKYLTTIEDIEVVAVISRRTSPQGILNIVSDLEYEIPVFLTLEKALRSVKTHVLVDFTTPEVAKTNFLTCIEAGVHPIIGTTGFDDDDQHFFMKLCEIHEFGGALIPNFSLGMLLTQSVLELGIRLFQSVVLLDMYSDTKKEIPSGTSKQLAKIINQTSGSESGQVPIYSLRLVGQGVNQQVKFGNEGETLTISHNVTDRICFGVGVEKAVKNIPSFNRLVTDLKDLI